MTRWFLPSPNHQLPRPIRKQAPGLQPGACFGTGPTDPDAAQMIGLGVIASVVFLFLAPKLLALLLVLAGGELFPTTVAIAGGIGSVVPGLAILVIT